ncbi:MAG TPA: hypothetical protein VL624_09015 [Caldimonas sp.]|nr:hypothetical protein [Caldimonas sp.]
MLKEVDRVPETESRSHVSVRHLRQVLLWPLRLIPAGISEDDPRRRAPWQALRAMGDASPWREHFDEYAGDAGSFHERHYNEFVSFLPYVQRFLYGEGRAQRGEGDATTGSPMRVFRRRDLAAVRVVPRPGDAPVTLQVQHVDLYFFYGVDLVLLNVEVVADDLPLPLAQELMYRFGRAYPPGWDGHGRAVHCMASVEWLDGEGRVVARSDVHERDAFLSHLAEHRAPRISEHWEHVLAPLVHHHSGKDGALRFRQIEYYRMPMMAYLAVDEPRLLTRSDFIRLGLVTGGGEALAGSDVTLPYAETHVADFESQFCYDRFWAESGAAPNTRYLCSGLALIAIGDARSDFYRCGERGVLAQFRHQHFLLFLIAHFQKATLLMVSDQLAEALNALDITSPESVKRFKRQIRLSYVSFLGFTHRYWFHEVSEQAQVKALFQLCTRHLRIDTLYAEVKERIHDMNAYLDADALRRQANTVVRLTVVTVFGLIGTITTGFLGMNLIAYADAPLTSRTVFFVVVLILAVVLTVYTVVKSKRLSDFLDAVSDERLTAGAKMRALVEVWRARR